MNTTDLLVLGAVGAGVYWLWRREKSDELLLEASRRGRRRNPARLTARERRELEAARRLSQEFHGSEAFVVELDPAEREVPRFGVALGTLEEMSYAPGRGSGRSGVEWTHESGDAGILRSRKKGKPLLVADPLTRRPILVQHRSRMKMSGHAGLIG